MGNLITVGTISEKVSYFPKHQHMGIWEIICYFDGSVDIALPNGTKHLEPVTIICIPPGIAHEEISVSGFRNYFIQVKELNLPEQKTYLFKDTSYKSFEHLAMCLFREFHLQRAKNNMVCTDILHTMESYLNSWLPATQKSLIVETIETELVDNIGNFDFQLEIYLESLPFSLGHIRRLFKQETGETPHSYLAKLRINHGKRLLTYTNIDIKTISLMCGLQDSYYYSRLFKKYTGFSPLTWSKRNKAGMCENNDMWVDGMPSERMLMSK